MFNPFNFTRGLSTSQLLCKEWKHVVSRRVAKRPEYKVGDERPNYIPPRQTTPDYKYGDSKFFPRSNKGLYGGAFIKSGHKISEFRQKANRFWKPNVHKKKLWSETLNKLIKVPVTSRVLKTIDKEGGLDQYLIKEKQARIKELGPLGWKLRYEVLKKKLQLENPRHKDATTYTTASGETGTIYYPNVKVENVKDPLNIIVGRRRLLKELYESEKRERKAIGEDLDGREFHDKFRELPAMGIISRLAKNGYDFKNISLEK